MIYLKDILKCIPVIISFYFLSGHICKSKSKNIEMFSIIFFIFFIIVIVNILTIKNNNINNN